jgi:hypothetical protein
LGYVLVAHDPLVMLRNSVSLPMKTEVGIAVTLTIAALIERLQAKYPQ